METSTHRPRLTWRDIQHLPETNRFIELIDGELIEMPGPTFRHQMIVMNIAQALKNWADDAGALVAPGPVDVLVDDHNVPQPDLVAYGPARVHLIEKRLQTAPPDLIVEVLSPSNRRHDLVRKRPLYERAGVPTLWFVDPETDEVRVDRLGPAGYGQPELATADGVLTVDELPGFALPVARVFPAR